MQRDPDIILPSGGGGDVLGQPGAGRAQWHKGRVRGLATDHPHQRRTKEGKNDQRRHRVTGQPYDRLAGSASKNRRLAWSNGDTVKEKSERGNEQITSSAMSLMPTELPPDTITTSAAFSAVESA